MHTSFSEIARRGLLFLRSRQKQNGGFDGESYQSDGTAIHIGTVFDTGLVMTALSVLPRTEELLEISSSALSFFDTERFPNGSYNYWQKDSPYFASLAYPNDLDDTVLSLSCYALYKDDSLEGEQMASLGHILPSLEIQEGGPYNTWLCDFVSDPRWRDVDIGVNANVAYLLSLLGIELPRLTSLLEQTITEHAYHSEYYCSPIVLMYFIARSYKGAYSKLLSDQIFDLLNVASSPLVKALGVSSLIRLGASPEKIAHHVEVIMQAQSFDGSWERDIVFLDPSTEKATWYHGSKELTTAYCLEAIALYSQKNQTKEKELTLYPFQAEKDQILNLFIKRARATSEVFAKIAEQEVARVLSYEISEKSMLLPYYFYHSLSPENQTIEEPVLRECGIANLSGWIGYTLLDEVLDGQQSGDILPFAVWCTRQVSHIYESLLPRESSMFIDEILSEIESSLLTERLSLLTKTASGIDIKELPEETSIIVHEKSLGHILPVLCILSIVGYKDGDELWDQSRVFFEHFLAARQLNDDAHDIVEDLSRGLVTTIGFDILNRYKALFPEKKLLYVSNEKQLLLGIFWKDIFNTTHSKIDQYVSESKKALSRMNLADTSYFEGLIIGLEKLQKKAKYDRDKTMSFLQAY